MIEIAIKFDDKFYKLAIKIYYWNVNSKVELYNKYISNCSRQIQTNRHCYNNNSIPSMEIDLI